MTSVLTDKKWRAPAIQVSVYRVKILSATQNLFRWLLEVTVNDAFHNLSSTYRFVCARFNTKRQSSGTGIEYFHHTGIMK